MTMWGGRLGTSRGAPEVSNLPLRSLLPIAQLGGYGREAAAAWMAAANVETSE